MILLIICVGNDYTQNSNIIINNLKRFIDKNWKIKIVTDKPELFGQIDTIEYNNCIEQDMINNQSNRLFNRFTTVPPNLTVNIDININDNNNINIGNNKVKIVKKVNGNKNISSNNKFRKK